ncbi:MAG TPA: hypothetical protein PKE29_04235 [Phycisphaerales bacterium]|nr:hypothetical protein [Phycisphaerales bacterium]
MTDHPNHPRTDRRSPVLGVSGITLLMVVTMVLSGPALGRAGDPLATGPRGLDQAVERVVPTDGAGHRLGGRRQLSSNHTRPVGGWAMVAKSRPTRTLASVCGELDIPAAAPPVTVGDRVGVRLLNLPPPSVL